MITGDLGAALAEAIRAAGTEGRLPATSVPSAAGTWRPVPGLAASSPGRYATTIPFQLAKETGADPAEIADWLAARLRQRAEISHAAVTGGGYLTMTVTSGALGALAVRITRAGPACARGGALRGAAFTARHADLASAPTWDAAYQRLTSEVTGRLAEAAGAQVTWIQDKEQDAERTAPAASPAHVADRAGTNPGPAPLADQPGPVAEAIEFAGADAIRFALCRRPGSGSARIPSPAGPPELAGSSGPAGTPGRARIPGLAEASGSALDAAQSVIDPRAAAEHHLGNPAYAVRYAHAHAASALRQAADLGLGRGDAAQFQPGLLAHPSERALLDAMSWLPERVGGAARRGQPRVLVSYLEDLASSYFDCQESSPAAPPGLPDEPPGSSATQSRLWLAAAARTALGTGLGLLGVHAPDRL